MEKNFKETKSLTKKQFLRWQKAMRIGYKVCRCHQLSDRSFHYKGMQLPVCARCLGILLGFFILGPVISIVTLGNMYLSLFLIFIMCLDGFTQLITNYRSNNIIRLLTGLGFGYALFSIIIHMIVQVIRLIN